MARPLRLCASCSEGCEIKSHARERLLGEAVISQLEGIAFDESAWQTYVRSTCPGALARFQKKKTRLNATELQSLDVEPRGTRDLRRCRHFGNFPIVHGVIFLTQAVRDSAE